MPGETLMVAKPKSNQGEPRTKEAKTRTDTQHELRRRAPKTSTPEVEAPQDAWRSDTMKGRIWGTENLYPEAQVRSFWHISRSSLSGNLPCSWCQGTRNVSNSEMRSASRWMIMSLRSSSSSSVDTVLQTTWSRRVRCTFVL